MDETVLKERMQAMMEKVKSDIDRVGWSSVGVFPTEPGGDTFTYSVGFTEHNHPEVIIAGVSPEIANALLGLVYDEIMDGVKFLDGERSPDILEKLQVEFRALPADGRPANVARRYYMLEDLPVLQMVWPDPQGKLPGEEGFDEKYGEVQDMERIRREDDE